jgi:hypothetical protein
VDDGDGRGVAGFDVPADRDVGAGCAGVAGRLQPGRRPFRRRHRSVAGDNGFGHGRYADFAQLRYAQLRYADYAQLWYAQLWYAELR